MGVGSLRVVVTILQIVLLARTIGWEAPPWAAQDRLYVGAAIRWRMEETGGSVSDVVFAPHQFSVAHLLDTDPPDMDVLLPLAAEILSADLETLPSVTHFWSPVYLAEPPYWADERCYVETDTIHRFYDMPGGRCRP